MKDEEENIEEETENSDESETEEFEDEFEKGSHLFNMKTVYFVCAFVFIIVSLNILGVFGKYSKFIEFNPFEKNVVSVGDYKIKVIKIENSILTLHVKDLNGEKISYLKSYDEIRFANSDTITIKVANDEHLILCEYKDENFHRIVISDSQVRLQFKDNQVEEVEQMIQFK